MHRILPIVIVSLLGAACGDDGGERLSAEEYRSEANAICVEGQERAEQLGEDFEEEFGDSEEMPSNDQLRDLMMPLLDDVEGQISDIRDLRGPEDLEADVQDALDEADEVIDEVRSGIEDDATALLQSDQDPFAELNERFDDLGLSECAD